ncbi:MAG: restriction endonuclease subunit S [Rhodopirellula sp.]|nr:restriction endonuclease subunit S [Rhodopirellula sp.]
MANDGWKTYRLGEVTENYDFKRVPVKEADRRPGPYPYYGASGVVDHVDQYIFDGEYLLIAEDGENLRSRKLPVAFIATGKFWVNNHAHIVTGNVLSNTRFLAYLLDRIDISGFLSGSTMPKLTQGNMNRIEVRLPTKPVQDAIVAFVSSLDRKLHVNLRMNRTLEKMAAAIFKSWFIDFDPVHAKAEGRDPGLPAEIADLFPDTFKDSDLGPTPKGWKPGSLGDVADSPRRGIKPSDVPPTTPYIGLEHMPRRSIALDAWGWAEDVASGKSQFKEGEILFGKLRPYFHKVGIAPVDGVCSTDIVVVTPKAAHWHGYVISLVSSKAFVDYTDSHSAGTKMPRTNWKDMSRYPLALPPEPLAKAFQDHVAPLHKRIGVNVRQNRRLAGLRDTLLPKLLSGEIELPAADTIAEEVT